MSYIINPKTGRKVSINGTLGKRLLRQYGGGCEQLESGYCELNFNDDNTPKINKNGRYSCHFQSLPGKTRSRKYRREKGVMENEKYCLCNMNRGHCKGYNSIEVPYRGITRLPETLNQKRKLEKHKRNNNNKKMNKTPFIYRNTKIKPNTTSISITPELKSVKEIRQQLINNNNYLEYCGQPQFSDYYQEECNKYGHL